MADPDLLELFIRPIHLAGLRYLVGGSVAAMHYSEPRFTIDVDVPLLVTPGDAHLLCQLFPSPEYYCPPEDIIILETNRDLHGHFNVIHGASGLKADFYPSNRDSYFGWAWKNKRTETTDQGDIYIAPPEFVILWKLEYYREGASEKHLRDISRIFLIQENQLDWTFLHEAVANRGLAEQLHLAKSRPEF